MLATYNRIMNAPRYSRLDIFVNVIINYFVLITMLLARRQLYLTRLMFLKSIDV